MYTPQLTAAATHWTSLPCRRSVSSTATTDPEADRRHSLLKLEALQRMFKELWLAGKLAPESSQWHKDNQHSYTMYLTNIHNSDIRLDRSGN